METTLPQKYQIQIERIRQRLPEILGENLYSCILYGSAVRGGIRPGISDINILIILNESTPEAHRAISECVQGRIVIDPFVIVRPGMERSFEAFSMKFRSIKRNYRVLYGEDPLARLKLNEQRLKFLCEQSIRNLRFRAVHTYVMQRSERRFYLDYLLNSYSTVLVELAEILRLSGQEVPRSFDERVGAIEKGFAVDVTILHDLRKLKMYPKRLRDQDVEYFHHGLFYLLDKVVHWVEEKWPMNS